jgi:hypothetical protein
MNLTLNDLMDLCSTCGGSGEQLPTTTTEQGSSYGMHSVTYPLSNRCNTCQGTGWGVLTPSGEVLREFLTILRKKQLI